MGWVTLVSFGITLASFGLFWLVWLRKGHYEMPATLRKEGIIPQRTIGRLITDSQEPSAHQEAKRHDPLPRTDSPGDEKPVDPMERNLFRFIKKMGSYLFFSDRDIILKDLGFEQMLYFFFLRRWIIFYMGVGFLVPIFIVGWARLTTDNWRLIVYRLLGSKESTITSLDFDTFMSSLITICVTFHLFSMRKYLSSRLCRTIVNSEIKTKHRRDIWYQTRTLKFRGVQPTDPHGRMFKKIIESYMVMHKVQGKIEKLILLPHLNEKIKLEKEKEEIQARYDGAY